MLTPRCIFLESVENSVDVEARLLFFNGDIFSVQRIYLSCGMQNASRQGLMGCFMGLRLALCMGLNFSLIPFLLNSVQICHSTFSSSRLHPTYLYFSLAPQSPNLQC